MKTLFILAGWLLMGLAAKAQQRAATADTSATGGVDRAMQAYTLAVKADSRLLNGPAYIDQTPAHILGKPFFVTDVPQRGAIAYDGNYFTQVPLLYDLNLDQVVLFDSVRGANIQLIKEKADYFVLDNHRFVRLPADSANTLTAGFYDLLLDGPVQLLAKRAKIPVKATAGRGIDGEYQVANSFFVHQNGTYYPVAKAGQVYKLFPRQKADLQKFARSNDLRFKTDSREASLLALVRYYSNLMR